MFNLIYFYVYTLNVVLNYHASNNQEEYVFSDKNVQFSRAKMFQKMIDLDRNFGCGWHSHGGTDDTPNRFALCLLGEPQKFTRQGTIYGIVDADDRF